MKDVLMQSFPSARNQINADLIEMMGIFSTTDVDASFNLNFKHAEDMMKH
jgi:hypothetical protein